MGRAPPTRRAQANQETPLLNMTTEADPYHGSYPGLGTAPSASLTVTHLSSQQKKKPVHTEIESLAQGQSQNQPIQCLRADGKMARPCLCTDSHGTCVLVAGGLCCVPALPHPLGQCTICPTVLSPIVQEAGKRQSRHLPPATCLPSNSRPRCMVNKQPEKPPRARRPRSTGLAGRVLLLCA